MSAYKIRIIGIFFCVSMLVGCKSHPDIIIADDTSEATEVPNTEQAAVKTAEDIYVYVCGHVKQPGVYKLTGDSRVYDALEMAGGVLEDGRAEVLNQAEYMTDGQTIYVPSLDEDVDDKSPDSKEDGRLNINTATKEELMTLPGIGESKAISIIQYREEHGTFQSIEELMEIPGIKKGVFNKISEGITVSFREQFKYKCEGILTC